MQFFNGIVPEYVGLALLNVVAILYLLAKKFDLFGGKAKVKAKNEGAESSRRSSR